MDKKFILVPVMAALLAGGVFAQSLFSAGGGISLTPSFGELKPESGDSQKFSGFDFGIHGFFDATYVEVSLGLLFGNNYKWDEGDDKGYDTTTLNLGLIGKYPISISDSFVLFPFAGIDYNINLAAKNADSGDEIKDEGDHKKADQFDALSILLGIGFDFSLTDTIYLRAKAAYGIVLNTKDEQEFADDFDVTVIKGKIPITLAVGFRF